MEIPLHFLQTKTIKLLLDHPLENPYNNILHLGMEMIGYHPLIIIMTFNKIAFTKLNGSRKH
jgi:hypothetical protein